MKPNDKVPEGNITQFQMLYGKVEALMEEVQKIQMILDEHNIYATTKVRANTDIDDRAFEIVQETARM